MALDFSQKVGILSNFSVLENRKETFSVGTKGTFKTFNNIAAQGLLLSLNCIIFVMLFEVGNLFLTGALSFFASLILHVPAPFSFKL